MKLTDKEKEMLENLINAGPFDDEQPLDSYIFLTYLEPLTNEEKGIIGSLCKKNIIHIVPDYECVDVFLNSSNRDKFINENLICVKGTYNGWWVLKSNIINDSTLDL